MNMPLVLLNRRRRGGAFSVWWGGIWRDEYTWVDNLNWNDGA